MKPYNAALKKHPFFGYDCPCCDGLADKKTLRGRARAEERVYLRNILLNSKGDKMTTSIKSLLIDYTREKIKKKDINVEDILLILAEEFPELIIANAEQNYLNGYKQALDDKEAVEKSMRGKKKKK